MNSERYSPGITYHDVVNDFELSYKVTYPDEQLDALIHYHECFEMVFYITADITAYIGDILYHLSDHDLLLIPPGNIHKLIYAPGQSYTRYVFYFTLRHVQHAFHSDEAKKAADLFVNKPYRKLSLSHADFIRLNSLLKNMYYHQKNTTRDGRYLATSYSSVILQEVYFIYKNQPPTEDYVESSTTIEQILKYINLHYSEKIVLQDFEKQFYLSRYYISRLFSKTLGVSLVEYLQYKRIIEAQRLLLDTKRSVIDISMDCGFNNIQHFYRIFKKVTGLTPSQFKNSQNPGITKDKTIVLN